ATLCAAIAAARTVVNLLDAMPAAATLARWQQAGERWLATARKTTRVVSGGAAVKLDALAETLTFHAVEDMDYRGRDAVQWIAQTPVRVLEGQARGTRGAAESGIEAGLLVSRVVDRENGQTLAVHYLLCDPALSAEGVQLARWARWAEAGEAQLRTLRHAMDHLGQGGQAGGNESSLAEAQACARLLALQMAVAALRLEQACDDSAAAFLARLTGRAPARQMPAAAVLVEGLGRLLALLDVLENYPGRGGRATPSATHEAPQEAFHPGDAAGLLEASMNGSRVLQTLTQGE
ncbi:hypothetical protein AB4156_37235, partial [Cupriavidus sp. 2MCAB6]